MKQSMGRDLNPEKQKVKTELNSFKKYKVKKVLALLTSDIDSIKTVNDWAEKAEVSKSWLAKAMKDTYGMLPKEILKKVRFEKIV